MKRYTLALSAVVAAILLAAQPVKAAPGDPIPMFDLVDLNGETHTYQQYEGQIVLLFFVGHN